MRAGLVPNAGGEVVAYTIARYRREFRLRIAPYLTDAEVASEMANAVRWIGTTSPAVFRRAELLVRLRALRHEAVIVRGWDATDPRVKWERDAR